MAVVTNTYTTGSAVGIREDLTDAIHRVDVEDTPFMSRVGTTTAKQTLHEWQTRSLSALDPDNAKPEGQQTARAASTPNVRLGNVCQISEKNATVSGTLETVNKAGRDSEMALQMADRTIELRKDMESILVSNQAYNTNATVNGETGVRQLRGFEAWIRTNTSRGNGGSDPADPTQTPATQAGDGDTRDFTEDLLLDNLQDIFEAGGNTKFCLMGPFIKRVASTFSGREATQVTVGARTISQATNMYVSDFGTVQFIPHRYLRSSGRTVLNVDPDMVKVAYLRKFVRFPLAKIGDADSRVILSEYSLEMCNEKAHGVIADLKTTA